MMPSLLSMQQFWFRKTIHVCGAAVFLSWFGMTLMAMRTQAISAPWALYAAACSAVSMLFCWQASRRVGREIAQTMGAALMSLCQQMDGLLDSDRAVPAQNTQSALTEVNAVWCAMAALRRRVDATHIPKEMLLDAKRWHVEILTGLLLDMRRQLNADATLLSSVSDYALLVQLQRGDPLPPEKIFDLAKVLDAATQAVRKQFPVSPRMNFTVSMQSTMPRQWYGQPEMLEVLFRHLMLLGLKRTHTGFVYVRLFATNSELLHLTYEDSGPYIAHWQVAHWLTRVPETEVPSDALTDISWMLIARLFQSLGGHINSATSASGGLMLEGTLAMQNLPAETHAAPLTRICTSESPILLVVEQASENMLAALCNQAGGFVFTVHTHAQAMEWVTALPFSALLLNDTVGDVTEEITHRLSAMKENGTLADIPCWVVSATHTFIEAGYWRNRGASEWLYLPITLRDIQPLVTALSPPDDQFYHAVSEPVREDFTPAINEAMPRMQQLLRTQVAQFVALLISSANARPSDNLAKQAHAVKSAALSLGYLRLAWLMGQIEQHAASPDFPDHNWGIIADCIKSFLNNELSAISQPAVA